MNITVNGKFKQFSGTIDALIKEYKLNKNAIVVERNNEIVHRDNYSKVDLCEGDKIELVQFVGGG